MNKTPQNNLRKSASSADKEFCGERFLAEGKAAWKPRSPEEARSGEFSNRGVAWKSIVEAVEAVHGGRWEEFRDGGDWERDAAIYLGWQRGRLKLQELAELSGGVGYTAVAQAIRRVRQKIARDKACRGRIRRG